MASTVNQLLFARTLFRDLLNTNWFATTHFCEKLYKDLCCYNNHTTIRGEKYSRQTLENFTLANKSWFVVLFHVFLIAVNYSRCFAWFSTRLRTKSAYLTNTKLLFLDGKCTYITTM